MSRLTILITAFLLATVSCGSDTPEFETLLDVGELAPGDVIALRAADDGSGVEYVSRRAGEIYLARVAPIDLPAGATNPELLASVPVSIDGEQRGLLGHTVIDGRRYAAWTDPDSLDLVVGELIDDGTQRLVWSGTTTDSNAIGGHLEARHGLLVLGLGSLTGWALDHGSGAIVTLDPSGEPAQTPIVLSDGWNNPFAFTVTDDGLIWVADNAPNGSDLPVDERESERIAAGDDRRIVLLEPPPQRAPSAIVALADGRLGVCGFLDNEMWAYEIIETAASDDAVRSEIERAGTIGSCLSGAAVLDDGSIVTATARDDGAGVIRIRRP